MEEEGEEEAVEGNGKYAPLMVDESDNVIFNATMLVRHGTMDDVFIIEKFDK